MVSPSGAGTLPLKILSVSVKISAETGNYQEGKNQMTALDRGYALLREWKGDNYIFGLGVLPKIGGLTARFGKRVMLVSTKTYEKWTDQAIESIRSAGGEPVPREVVLGARPNAPREDVYRIESDILHYRPDVIVSFGGGSTIDAVKAAIVLSVLGKEVSPEIDHYFGTGIVSAELERTGCKLIPHIAVETASSSGAHLTKYSNITDPESAQKLLIVDPAIVPQAALFDYRTSCSMPKSVTIDGALDGIAHTFEVFCGAKPATYEKAKTLCETALELILENTKAAIQDPQDETAREALGVATDLGGYAIMVGGTSGGHLTSFSLIDVVSHGTACGIMNPYYAVFYAPAIQEQLSAVGKVLLRHGFLDQDPEALLGRERAEAVAEGMRAFARSIGAPTTLSELPGFTEAHTKRILSAAKKPELQMKLQNMPVPMTAADVDPYMAPVIRAAVSGNLSLIRNRE